MIINKIFKARQAILGCVFSREKSGLSIYRWYFRQAHPKLFLLLLVVFNTAHAIDTYKIKKDDNIETIALDNLQRHKDKYGNRYKEFAHDIIQWNPSVKDWTHPPKDQIIYLSYPYEEREAPKVSLNAYYASTFGAYKEKTAAQDVSSAQNFPVTLGLGLLVTNKQQKHYLMSGLYIAQPSKGTISGNSTSPTTEFTIPREIGANIYYLYYFSNYHLGLYSGYDFEKLNTLNTSEIISGSSVVNIDNKLHYLTVGANQAFTMYKFKMNVKLSFSKTFASSTSGSKPLVGYKYMLYYTFIPKGRFSINVFYKHHSLSGPTDLSIDRLGFSVGYAVLVF